MLLSNILFLNEGMLGYPTAMQDKMRDFCVLATANYIFARDPKRLPESLVAKKAWREYYKQIQPNPTGKDNQYIKEFEFDITGWGYDFESLEQFKDNETGTLPKIRLRYTVNDQGDGAGRYFGLMKYSSGPVLSILVNNEIDFPTTNPLTEKKYVEGIVIHELRHLSQDLLRKLKTGNYEKEKDTGNLSFGSPGKSISGKGERGQNPTVAHKLMDVEFYTNLGDSLSTLQYKLREIDPKTREYFFKIFVGINEKPGVTDKNLRILKNENYKKWMKAVKELYKEVFNKSVESLQI